MRKQALALILFLLLIFIGGAYEMDKISEITLWILALPTLGGMLWSVS